MVFHWTPQDKTAKDFESWESYDHFHRDPMKHKQDIL